MAYSEYLSDRILQFLREKSIPFTTKKMMGGLLFMVDDKMYVGVNGDEVMARIHPDLYEQSLLKEGCKEMNFTPLFPNLKFFIDNTLQHPWVLVNQPLVHRSPNENQPIDIEIFTVFTSIIFILNLLQIKMT